MSRRKTARQIKRQRMANRLFSLITIVALFLVLAIVLKKFVLSDLSKNDFIYGYQYPESILTMNVSDVSKKSPALFAENLAVLSQDSEPDPSIVSETGITINDTAGTVVYSKNGREHLYPASVTKVMTLLVALKYGDLSKSITVESYMLANLDPESSVAGFKPGDTLTLEQLLYGLMLPSGNDAANAIAYMIAGSEQGFVDLMNDTALRIGATDTHFVNAHGLNDPAHFTTAYDIYLMYHELFKYDFFYEVVGRNEYRTSYMNNGQTVENLWVRGIWYFTGQATAPEGVTPIGGKTGTTPEAQYCLSLASKDDQENKYVSVVLRAGTREGLYQSMSSLLSKIKN